MAGEFKQLLIFCEGMRVGMAESQSKTLDDLMNAAMAEVVGDTLEIKKLENDLAAVYNRSSRDAVAIAILCDEHLDKSGAMLGRIRNIVAALGIIEREEAEGEK